MAEWKKVIVSGSAAELASLDVDGAIIAASFSGSFSGSFEGDGSSLTGITATSLDIDNFGSDLTGITVAGTDLLALSDAGTEGRINVSQLSTPLAGTGLEANSGTIRIATAAAGAGLTGGGGSALAVGAGTHITVNATNVEVNTTTLTPAIWAASASYSGSILDHIAGDVNVDVNGVSSIGSGVIVDADVNASAAIAASKINFSGTSFVSASVLSSPAQGRALLTTNGVAGTTVDLGLQTTDSPQFVALTLTGDLAVNGGDITTSQTTATVFNTTATTVNAFGAATSLNLGAATGTTTVGNSLVVTGDLFVNGTTTQVNTTDLLVEDKFILLASGSATAGDGGFIVDRGSDAAGNIAYGYDAGTDRWGFQSGLSDTTNALDPTSASGVSGSFAVYSFTEAAHGATKPITGEFAVVGSQYLDNAGNFWVYTA
jgi:hypothetical protein